jgi:hypothetical protein
VVMAPIMPDPRSLGDFTFSNDSAFEPYRHSQAGKRPAQATGEHDEHH